MFTDTCRFFFTAIYTANIKICQITPTHERRYHEKTVNFIARVYKIRRICDRL